MDSLYDFILAVILEVWVKSYVRSIVLYSGIREHDHLYPTVKEDYLNVVGSATDKRLKKEAQSNLPAWMQRETKYFSFKKTGDRFGFSTHTTWETFQKTLVDFKI